MKETPLPSPRSRPPASRRALDPRLRHAQIPLVTAVPASDDGTIVQVAAEHIVRTFGHSLNTLWPIKPMSMVRAHGQLCVC